MTMPKNEAVAIVAADGAQETNQSPVTEVQSETVAVAEPQISVQSVIAQSAVPGEAAHDRVSSWFNEEVERRKRDIDTSSMDPDTLVSGFVDAQRCLDALKDWRTNRPLTQEQGVQLADMLCDGLAIVLATSEVIFERIKKNRTNANFGLYLIGIAEGDETMVGRAHAELTRIALGIPRRHGWHHRDARHILQGLTNDLLVKERRKHQELDVVAILTGIVGNRFAYIYTVLKRGFVDELRKLYRHPEDQLPQEQSELEAIGGQGDGGIEAAEAELQREDVLTLLKSLESSERIDEGSKALLRVLRRHIENPEACLGDGLLDGDVTREVAQIAGVSERQARSYRRNLGKLSETDPKLRDLKEQVRRLKLRFLRSSEDDETPES